MSNIDPEFKFYEKTRQVSTTEVSTADPEFKLRYVDKTETLEDELKLLSAQLGEGRQRFDVIRGELKRRRETRDEQPPMTVVTKDSVESNQREIARVLSLKVTAMEAEQAKLVLEVEIAKIAQREAEERLAILAKLTQEYGSKLSGLEEKVGKVIASEERCVTLEGENDELRGKLDEFERRVQAHILAYDENANLREALERTERQRELDRSEMETSFRTAHDVILKLNNDLAEASAGRDHHKLCFEDAIMRERTIEAQLAKSEHHALHLRDRIAELEKELESRVAEVPGTRVYHGTFDPTS